MSRGKSEKKSKESPSTKAYMNSWPLLNYIVQFDMERCQMPTEADLP